MHFFLKLQSVYNKEHWPQVPIECPQVCHTNTSFRLVSSYLYFSTWTHGSVLALKAGAHMYLFHEGVKRLSSSVSDSPDVWLNVGWVGATLLWHISGWWQEVCSVWRECRASWLPLGSPAQASLMPARQLQRPFEIAFGFWLHIYCVTSFSDTEMTLTMAILLLFFIYNVQSLLHLYWAQIMNHTDI